VFNNDKLKYLAALEKERDEVKAERDRAEKERDKAEARVAEAKAERDRAEKERDTRYTAVISRGSSLPPLSSRPPHLDSQIARRLISTPLPGEGSLFVSSDSTHTRQADAGNFDTVYDHSA
jgi:septal ring factor EnvC (AmiA/AmiB activator)